MANHALPRHRSTGPDEIRRAVRRSHGLRTLGLALGFVMVASVLYQRGAPAAVWVLLVLHGLVWPHVVRQVVQRSAQPLLDDERCFLVDTAMGGVWIALMQFNLLPSVALVMVYSMVWTSIGGAASLLRAIGAMVLACGVAAVAGGLAFAPATGMPELLAAVPLLVVFPITLGIILHRLAGQVHAQNRLLRRVSSIDSLSGLLNRRHWEAAVDAAIGQRFHANAAMLLIDIDHFKRVNDQYGHAAGDEVIRRLGAVIRDNLREGDLAGRYGGDEFAVMLEGADAPATGRVAERIRSGVACSLFESVPGLHCSVSIGMAPYRSDFTGAAEWIGEADGALYRAKLAGRNRFIAAG